MISLTTGPVKLLEQYICIYTYVFGNLGPYSFLFFNDILHHISEVKRQLHPKNKKNTPKIVEVLRCFNPTLKSKLDDFNVGLEGWGWAALV